MNVITRRHFLSGLAAGAAAAATSRRVFAQNGRKPNIILIMADDLGYGDIGCYGNTTTRTPNLDALAAAGMRFTDYHSNGAVCTPTRAALLTGRYQQRCGIDGVFSAARHRDVGMPLEEVTFAEVLKSAGYVTAIFGKWHLGYVAAFNPSRQGFDYFRGYVSGNVDYHSHIDQEGYTDWWDKAALVPEAGYSTDLITAHACRFIEENKDRPFLLYIPHEAPHYPYQGRKDPPERANPDGEGKLKKLPSRQDVPGAYREMVEAMDEGVGKVVETLKRLGLEKDTFLFFCSDNGACPRGNNAPLRGFKGSLLEGGHRVPAIAYWPGKIAAGAACDQTVLGMDLFPTMAALAGAKLPEGRKLDGVNLLTMLTGGEALAERTVFWRAGNQKAARHGPWKLLLGARDTGVKAASKGRKKSAGAGETDAMLFNLTDDLGEHNDLAAAHPERVKELRAALRDWEAELTDVKKVS